MRLELPLPPSGNRYWRLFRGRLVRSSEATAYIELVRWRFVGARQGPPQDAKQKLAIVAGLWMSGRGDLDNRVKVLLDALQRVAYVDDKQVWSLEAHRFEARPSATRCEVFITPWVRTERVSAMFGEFFGKETDR